MFLERSNAAFASHNVVLAPYGESRSSDARCVYLPASNYISSHHYLTFINGSSSAFRWLGHRKPEAIDLMSVTCGVLQKKQFERLWTNMSTNTCNLIKHSIDYRGWVNSDDVSFLDCFVRYRYKFILPPFR